MLRITTNKQLLWICYWNFSPYLWSRYYTKINIDINKKTNSQVPKIFYNLTIFSINYSNYRTSKQKQISCSDGSQEIIDLIRANVVEQPMISISRHSQQISLTETTTSLTLIRKICRLNGMMLDLSLQMKLLN